MAAKLLSGLANVKKFHWHYLEAGHGKGAPDGVGGCIKRTADNLVARGIDIPNIAVLMEQLKIHCTGVHMFYVSEAEIDELDKVSVVVPLFKGTLKSHEISWSKDGGQLINIRRLTCTLCLAEQNCHHYGIGQMSLKEDGCILLYTLMLSFLLYF